MGGGACQEEDKLAGTSKNEIGAPFTFPSTQPPCANRGNRVGNSVSHTFPILLRLSLHTGGPRFPEADGILVADNGLMGTVTAAGAGTRIAVRAEAGNVAFPITVVAGDVPLSCVPVLVVTGATS